MRRGAILTTTVTAIPVRFWQNAKQACALIYAEPSTHFPYILYSLSCIPPTPSSFLPPAAMHMHEVRPLQVLWAHRQRPQAKATQPFIKKLTGRLLYMHFALQFPTVDVVVVIVIVLIRSVLLIRSTFEAPNQNLPRLRRRHSNVWEIYKLQRGGDGGREKEGEAKGMCMEKCFAAGGKTLFMNNKLMAKAIANNC